MDDLTQRIPTWDAGRRSWQRILNAAPIPPRSSQRNLPEPVEVEARVVWERDGEETIRTRAHGWSGRLAYVELRDARAEVRWVWLSAAAVRRG